ncbi:MAG: heme exporter protein CcmB [Ignavibacteriota bacterium]
MISPVLRKDLRIELRSRFGVSAVVVFLLVTVTTILFSAPGEQMSSSIMSALFWISLFFGALTGLSRSFIAEEERGTAFLLRLYAEPETVFWGKYLFNLLLVFSLAFCAVVFFLFFFRDFVVRDWPMFFLQLALGALGTSSIVTILSALVARASQKGALLPVLALPVMLPLIIAATDATRITMEVTESWSGIRGDILILFSFDVAVTLVSYVLFHLIWQE